MASLAFLGKDVHIATGPVKVAPLFLVGGGVLLLWSGITGKKWSSVLRDLVSGKNPSKLPTTNPITGGGNIGPGSPAGSTTDSAIANTALQYQGHCYVFGGIPGTDGRGCWDCSSFVNYVLGVRLHLAIPGFAGYNGTSHGPPTGAYLLWGGKTVIPRAAIQAGDLCVWQTHMGIAISNTEMISAVDPAEGTRIGTIDGGGPPGEVLVCMVVNAAGGTPGRK